MHGTLASNYPPGRPPVQLPSNGRKAREQGGLTCAGCKASKVRKMSKVGERSREKGKMRESQRGRGTWRKREKLICAINEGWTHGAISLFSPQMSIHDKRTQGITNMHAVGSVAS